MKNNPPHLNEPIPQNDDIIAIDENDIDKPSPKEELPKKPKRRFFWHNWRNWSKKKKIIVLVVVLVVILGGGGATYALTRHQAPVAKAPVISKPIIKIPPSSTVASDLTGLQVSPSVNQRPVTGVMIENSLDARPQSGLIDAGVVFEAVTEGGITRFLALFQDTQPSSLGPVRSLRPYFLSWDMGFDAPIAHVGGSPEALSDLSSWGGKDLDEFYNGSYYQRITSRQAPHNVYTSIAQLNTLEATKGWTSSTYTSFPRKADSPEKTPTVATINFNPSSADYAVSYAYDPTTNTYNRSEGGSPMTDATTGNQISPKVVIAMVVPLSQGALDASGAYYSDFSVIGSGQADIFQDGGVTTGTWTKTSNSSQIKFTNSSGKTIDLDAGQTWITALGLASEISYN